MKRILSLLFFMFFLTACDDGDLTLETIAFKDTTTKSCSTNNVLYKLKQNEALLLEIPKTAFVNEPTNPGAPRVLNIKSSDIRVVYRSFNGAVADDNICNTIPPATPIVVDQWIATEGMIEITTSTINKEGTILGSTIITGYNHRIVFKNITFDKKNGTKIGYETFDFGDFISTITPLVLGFDKNVEQCPSTKDIYNYNSGESLTLENIDANLIINEETPLNTPRTALIGTTKNKLSYRAYNGLLTPSYFCNSIVPTTPIIIEEWNAESGIAAVSGIIEVTTIKSGTSAFKHSIVIKKATLKSGNKSFKLGDAYNYGEFLAL
jgi:hypothetical protein